MSKTLRIAALAAIAALSSGVHAADNADLTVTASVSSVCKLTAVPAMNFGALDPSANSNATASSVIEYKCTKGVAPSSFTVGGQSGGSYSGTLTGASASPDSIAYAIAWTAPTAAGSGFGDGAEKTVTLNGTIQYANFQNVKADTYSATVAIIIDN